VSFVEALIAPPGGSLLFLLVSALVVRKYRRTAITLASIGFAWLFVLSMPIVADTLMTGLQESPPLSNELIRQVEKNETPAQARVVLGGGRQPRAVEYGDIDTVNRFTLERLRYAAWLDKKLSLPILLSGGSVHGEATSEAVLMNQVMMSSFGIAPRWIESQSRNTAENATYTAQLLNNQNVETIILVTHAWHMPRAKLAFEKQGFKVIAAPMGYAVLNPGGEGNRYLPSAEALHQSCLALHEILGSWWYWIS